MQYRREIDGLRAFAVLPVIFYHAHWSWWSGGFVGVDVFFVISGYLITLLLLQDWQAGQFSIVNFYERRVRRIIPALIAVLIACLPLAWWLLLPHELVAFARSLLAVLAFVSNLLFWYETDYFATDADLLPLLHTWSLAVEEQFYLFFPLLLWFLLKRGRAWVIGGLVGLAVLSFIWCEWISYRQAATNFFLLPSRAWELLVGAGAALLWQAQSFAKAKPRWLEESLAGLGLAAIVASALWLDDRLRFPSLYALAPTVGAALVILFATPRTLIGQWLGLKPLVGIGLISYSAYLWHQPLFAFARLGLGDEPATGWMLVLISLSLMLAALSWRFVERPFRQREHFSRLQVFTIAALASLSLAVLAGLMIYNGGFPARFE